MAPPPAGEAEHRVRLHSRGAGSGAGEKLLRRLLLACPEWSCAEARAAAADAAEASGDASTAACVRAKASPALRKSSMLALVRAWNYKCDVFHSGGPEKGDADGAPSSRPASSRGARVHAVACGTVVFGTTDGHDSCHALSVAMPYRLVGMPHSRRLPRYVNNTGTATLTRTLCAGYGQREPGRQKQPRCLRPSR